MRELRLEQQNNTVESEEQKRSKFNHFWNDPDYKINIEGKNLSMKECYDKVIEQSQQIFEKTRVIALEQIPKGKYILYINSTIEGVARNKNIKYIDNERLEKMYKSETGSSEINPENFQERNMRYCLGLAEEDTDRFKTINLFKEEIPTNLSNCVGIVFSGSEADITDEAHIERIDMTKKARTLVTYSKKLKIPKLGICFGGQLIANEAGAKIQWILDQEGNKNRITGVNEISEKETAEYSTLPIEFPSSVFYVAKNHGQRIERGTIPADGEILAESKNGEVEMIYFSDTNTICTQFHPEVNPIRLDIAESMADSKKDNSEFFIKNPEEIRATLFPSFLKIVGNYSRENLNR